MAKPINEDGLVRVTYQSAATLKEASRLVLPYCAENNNGKTCEVFYSNCTEPVLIR
jgi:hypothetical protein